MTLMDAPAFGEKDLQKAKRKVVVAISAVVILCVALVVHLFWPFYTARRTVNRFMAACVKGNFQEAYVIWQANPRMYSMDRFMQDWGPNSPYGVIKTYRIEQLGRPPGRGPASGMVALVLINGMKDEEARIWIQDKSELLSFYQF